MRNLYMNQKGKVRLDQGETNDVETVRGVRRGCCMSPNLFNLCEEWLTEEILKDRHREHHSGRQKDQP